MSSIDSENNPSSAHRSSARDWIMKIFLHWGVMPFLLVIAVITFSLMSSRFLTPENLINLFRQSVYLVLVSLGSVSRHHCCRLIRRIRFDHGRFGPQFS